MAARTSLTDPLLIAELPLPGDARLGITYCPGKRDAHARGGAWARDLALDIERIRAWGADAVLTLVETGELALLGVPDLPAAMRAQSFEWHHLPIRDVGIPAPPFEERWCYSGHRARRWLCSGGRVLVHCRGGLGRAGTIAARLLIETGEAPAAAVARVRAVRPGAIETAAQERYARAHADARTGDPLAARVLGCLLGGAIGDAFGYQVEFDSLAAIRARHGPAGLRAPAPDAPLTVSDDTQMTLFALEGLLDARAALAAGDADTAVARVRHAFLDWLATQDGTVGRDAHGTLAFESVLNARRAPGLTCLSALREGAGRGSPAAPLNDSKGCGGVMRAAPCGLFPALLDATSAFELGARTAALTHGHPSGYLSAAAMAAMVRQLVAGGAGGPDALRDAAQVALALLGERTGHAGTTAALRAALARAASPRPDPQADVAALGAGWVGEEALAIGLYAALRGDGFADTLAIAANHDGDSDSTASIAGQLWGAAHGLAGIPHAWVERLDVLEPALGLLSRTLASSPA